MEWKPDQESISWAGALPFVFLGGPATGAGPKIPLLSPTGVGDRMDRNELLAHRDEGMAEIHARIASPNRSDLSPHTYRLWKEVGAINRELRRLDAKEEGLLEKDLWSEGRQESLINDARQPGVPDQPPAEAKQRSKWSPRLVPVPAALARARTEPLEGRFRSPQFGGWSTVDHLGVLLRGLAREVIEGATREEQGGQEGPGAAEDQAV